MGNQPSHRLEPKNKKKVMDRLRRSLRDSFRKRRDSPEASKPNHWIEDETAVRNGTCHFPVKYLGCVEVFESRGMQVCEEALKLLRTSRRRPLKGILFVTGDGLRVVDDETKGLIVDQTIEKVSFCAPDRGHERGFSYICRDGTTRRWMCHGFLAIKDTGERLSHAVGCAFAVCLERKQKRDKESVMMTFDPKTSTFTRTGSFRQSSLTERMTDPQECKPSVEPPPVKTPAPNPYAIERPHAAPNLLQRQNSFRLNHSGVMSPFKRQLSLRLDELPSTLERQRAMSLGSAADFFQQNGGNKIVTPIPENSPIAEQNSQDSISAMCQQLTQDLTFLSTHDTPYVPTTSTPPAVSEPEPTSAPVLSTNPWASKEGAAGSNRAEAWLATVEQQTRPQPAVIPPPRKSSPNFSHLRTQSLGHADMFHTLFDSSKAPGTNARDPFDAEWAALAMRHQPTNNPFARHSSVTEVQM